MDIVAKDIPADKNGVRIAELNEMEFRRSLWDHRPLTDFWRVGPGYTRKLEKNGLYTMGDIARCSVKNENILYDLFGKNAELLIDHAWGWEPCTVKDIKAYKPSTNSLGSGQVLQQPYDADKAKLVLREMTDFLVLDLVEKRLVTNQIVVTIGYDVENLTDENKCMEYTGDVIVDGYGRKIPKHAHGSANLGEYTSSTKKILTAVSELFDRIINSKLLVRRINITAANVVDETTASQYQECEQLDLFTDQAEIEQKHQKETEDAEREKKMQKAMLSIKNKFGKNAILKGMNLEQGATAKERNEQIGGHKA
jgi:DNA polymerase V